MQFGLDLAQHQLTWDALVGRARLAEEWGFDGVWLFDHFTALYGDRLGPCMEAWTLLAALAAETDRLRLGTLVTGMTYRHPSVLATQAVTVDHISNGRVELGVGAGWHAGEHRALGIDLPGVRERIERLEEGIDVMRLLMTVDGVSYEGVHHHLENATYRPRPVQQPHPPVWVGASGTRRMLPLAGRVADVWHTFGDPETIRRKGQVVDAAAEEVGRDPAAIRRATNVSLSGSLDGVRRAVEGYAAAGVDYLVASWPEQGAARVEEVAETVLPEWA